MQVIFMMKRPAIFCSIVIAAALIFTFTVAMLKRAPKTLGSKIEEGVSLEKVSENVTFVSPEGNYSLKITAVYDAPPESDDENAPPAKRVAVVVYEYTNNDIENGLVMSNSHFKAFDKNGNELKQFPQKNLFVVLFSFCYHSICSTGMGFSLISTLLTLPFFILITLSAIGVSAELWVITITVIPFSLQVSCKSFKIDLPV